MQRAKTYRLVAVTLAALVLGTMAARAGTTYQVTQLPTLGGSSAVGTAINVNGQIVGYSTTAGGATHATVGIPGDGWTGLQPGSGSIRVVEQVAQLVTYSITCAVGAQSVQASTNVTYTVMPSSGGGGALDLITLLILLIAVFRQLAAAREESVRDR
jgi:hypothetical protein